VNSTPYAYIEHVGLGPGVVLYCQLYLRNFSPILNTSGACTVRIIALCWGASIQYRTRTLPILVEVGHKIFLLYCYATMYQGQVS
jgi:hypothetical protein